MHWKTIILALAPTFAAIAATAIQHARGAAGSRQVACRWGRAARGR